jgi:peptidoglycan-N-acetylglucosamine deacetylase
VTGDRQRDGAAVSSKRLTLTFDNGPTPGITERVLDILARHGLQATFFVIGRQLRDPAAAALLPKIEQAGHRIGNHTLNHRVAFGDRPDAAFAHAEIEEAQALIATHAGAEKLFRPYGLNRL